MEGFTCFARGGGGSAAGSAVALQNSRSSAYRLTEKSAKSHVSDPSPGLHLCASGRGGVSGTFIPWRRVKKLCKAYCL